MQHPKPPQLADLVRLDWFIIEKRRLINATKASIANRDLLAPESVQDKARLNMLVREHQELVAERQVIREYFARSK
jgi:hypothetical protein